MGAACLTASGNGTN